MLNSLLCLTPRGPRVKASGMTWRPRLVLFDIGGVLADLRPENAQRAWREVMGPGSDVFETVEGSGAKAAGDRGRLDEAGMCAHAAADLGRPISIEQLRITWGAMVAWRSWVLPLLARLQIPYGLLSNICPVHARVLGPLPGASPVIYSCEVGTMKPEAEIYRIVTTRTPFAPSQILYLDDLSENVVAGNRAGLVARQVCDRASVEIALDGVLAT